LTKESFHPDRLRVGSRPHRQNLQSQEVRHDEVSAGSAKHGEIFIGITVKSIPQLYNREADDIAKATALQEPLPPNVFYETMSVRSAVDEGAPPKFVNAIHNKDWHAPIVVAIKGYYDSKDGVVDKRVAIRARNYHIIDDKLYRKGVCAPLLKCISATEGKQLLHEIHSGMCSHHIGTRALVQKAFRQGFY
jgi:hypothetical protein